MLLARVAARGEGAVAPPHGDADRARVHQLLEPRGELRPHRQGLEHVRGEGVLGLRPGLGAGVRGVLEPAVGVCDAVSVQVLDEVEPGGLGVAHRTHVSGRVASPARRTGGPANSAAPIPAPRVRMGQPAGLGATGGPRRPEVIRAACRVRVRIGGPSRPTARPDPVDPACALSGHHGGDPAAQRHVRAAVRRLEPAGHRARAGREGRVGRRHPGRGARRDDQPPGARGGAADPLRPGAVPVVGAAVPPRGLHPGRADLRLLRQLGHEHRPRRAPQPRRDAHVGQRRRRLSPLQPHQGRPVTRRDGLGAAAPAADARAARRGGCSARARSTRAGGSGSACPRASAHELTRDRPPAVGSRRAVPRAHLLRRRVPGGGDGGRPQGLLADVLRVPRRAAGRRRARGGDRDLLQLRAVVRRPARAGGLGGGVARGRPRRAAGRGRRRRPPGARRRLAGLAGGGRGGATWPTSRPPPSTCPAGRSRPRTPPFRCRGSRTWRSGSR